MSENGAVLSKDDILRMNSEQSIDVGREIGRLAPERPEVTRAFLIGIRWGLEEIFGGGCPTEGMGDVLHWLERRQRATHPNPKIPNEDPPISSASASTLLSLEALGR